jgi:hypothetical protein
MNITSIASNSNSIVSTTHQHGHSMIQCESAKFLTSESLATHSKFRQQDAATTLVHHCCQDQNFPGSSEGVKY